MWALQGPATLLCEEESPRLSQRVGGWEVLQDLFELPPSLPALRGVVCLVLFPVWFPVVGFLGVLCGEFFQTPRALAG